MSVNVMVFGADRDSDEYRAALKLKGIISESIPSTVSGEIVLFASATLFGQSVKDVDLLMIGQVQDYSVNTEFFVDGEGFINNQVEIKSFCTAIEIKRHDITGVFMNGTDVYVKYGLKNHCVTNQSNKQKESVKQFFQKTISSTPFVTNIIWFTQITPKDIRGLLSNSGKQMRSNILGSDFLFKDLMQLIIWQKPPYKNHFTYVYDASYHATSLSEIQQAISLFSRTKTQMGELTRRRIEQITNKSFENNVLVDTNGKVSIYRGKAGTGKTVGLIQTAIRLVDDEQARVLMMTYNKALVSDIRRLFALAELPDMFEKNCLHICTMHSYFYRVANVALYDGKMSGSKFLDKYDAILKELNSFLCDDDSVSLIKEVCASDAGLDWDYVLIDEAQDWTNNERDIILKLFENGRIIVADGGQQFVRRIDVCDWSVIRDRNNIKLKHCLRQKENLVEFINMYTKKLDILGGKVLTKNNMPGGKVIITTDDKLIQIHNDEMKFLKNAGNIAYDMLYLVPHSLVKKENGANRFLLTELFEQNGTPLWDGTDSRNRENYSIDADEFRLLQYDSARGLEGWTVVCMDFDVFLEEKSAEYSDGVVDQLRLQSPEERKKEYLYNWAMIPLTRAIDTLVITIKDPKSPTGKLLEEISVEGMDFINGL